MAFVNFEEAMEDKSYFVVFDPNGKEYEGYWSDIRVDRDTLPEGWYAYDIRESDSEEDDEWWLATIEENYVFVNHAGTFLTEEKLPLEEDASGRKRAYFSEDWDYSFE